MEPPEVIPVGGRFSGASKDAPAPDMLSLKIRDKRSEESNLRMVSLMVRSQDRILDLIGLENGFGGGVISNIQQ